MPSQEFLSATKLGPPDVLLAKAVSLTPKKELALDLGCGSGKDTRFLLETGFQVIAVDKDPKVEEFLEALPHQEKLKVVISSFEDFKFETYDLINARFSLPFVAPQNFPTILQKIKSSLNQEGTFIGQLFGERDAWNKGDETKNFHSAQQARHLFQDLDVVDFIEIEYDGFANLGAEAKHWHVFHIIARKKT